MREIKFRAWDKEAKAMWVWDEGREGWVDKFNICEWIANGSHRFSFMQYTGLKDKNGKDVYEGDVLASQRQPHSHIDHLEPAIIGDVVYNDNLASFRIRIEHHGNSIGESNTMKFTPYNHYEVIGNIYENPELCPAS